MRATESDLNYALDIARGEGTLAQWSKTLEAIVADHRQMKLLLDMAIPHIASAGISCGPCDPRAIRAHQLWTHMGKFLMAVGDAEPEEESSQAAAPQMTSGEFAGLVKAKCDFYGWYQAPNIIERLAREHNIEIVEPKT